MDIDPRDPKSRLELALKLAEMGDEERQWAAMEIVVGRRVDAQENQYAMLFMMYQIGAISAREFYSGFL